MRGYFGVGTDGMSKAMNLGNLMRIAHAFGASFFFTIGGRVRLSDAQSDTSDASGSVPMYHYDTPEDLRLPQGCQLVGVEIADDAVLLPSFKHPSRAAYIFGAERLSLSAATLSRCAHVVRIPTRFSINVGMAGAIVMYDRLIAEGRYPARPIRPGAPVELPPAHEWGPPVIRNRGAGIGKRVLIPDP